MSKLYVALAAMVLLSGAFISGIFYNKLSNKIVVEKESTRQAVGVGDIKASDVKYGIIVKWKVKYVKEEFKADKCMQADMPAGVIDALGGVHDSR